MTATKSIYLIRHGETEYNRLGIVQGSGVDSELNESGQRQAQLFYEAYHHIPFDKVYTSALIRTHQSVDSFLKAGIPHTVLAELNEISWGDYEGHPANPDWKAAYFRMIDAWNSGNLELRTPNGESPVELQERQKRALGVITGDMDVRTALICMHGRAMKSFLCLMLGLPLTSMDEFSHTNLCLYQLEYDGEGFSLLKRNSRAHLELAGS